TQKPAARRVFVFYRKTGCGALPFLRAISWRLKRADRGPSAASLPRPPDAVGGTARCQAGFRGLWGYGPPIAPPASLRSTGLLRLAAFCGAPRRALAKTGALLRVAVAQIGVAHAVRLQIWTAAPAPARLFLPLAAPRLRSHSQLPVSAAGSGRCSCPRTRGSQVYHRQTR